MPSNNDITRSFDKGWLRNLPDEVNMQITVETVINPTEDREKVLQAAKLISPTISSFPFELSGQKARFILENIYQIIISQQILDATRRHLLNNLSSDMKITVAFINKQVALHGRLNFVEEAPMGPIVLRIETNNMENVLNHYFPKAEWCFPRKRKKKSKRRQSKTKANSEEIIEDINVEDIDLDALEDEEDN
ncbi:MAG: RNA-binding domain-containing protein [Candidatus Hodarchaeales archaeon]|jgi:predicted RNA binding protein with dsRBD fold (UPF0201 family)